MGESYELVSITQKSHIDPGETAEIELYLTGHGKLERNKLHILHSFPNLFARDDYGVVQFPIAGILNESGDTVGISSGKYVGNKELGDTATMVHLPSSYFFQPSRSLEDSALPDIAAEGSHGGMAPISVSVNTSKEAPPGDYDFTFTLSYEGSDGNIEQSQQTATIHVNGFVEQYNRELKIIGLTLATLSILVSLGI